MLEIYVDGDACPVKDEVLKVALRHNMKVHMVSNSYLRISAHPLVNPVVVAQGPDAADDWIVEHICEGDIAITADILLADRCLKNLARVIAPTGKLFDEGSIGMAVAMRDLNAHLRDSGEIRGGAPAFGKQDRSRFLGALEHEIQALKRC